MDSLHHTLQALIAINDKQIKERKKLLSKYKDQLADHQESRLAVEKQFLIDLNREILKRKRYFKYLINKSK